jgi:hypothetical protein
LYLRAAEKTKKKEEAVAATPAGPTQEDFTFKLDLLKK